MVGCGAVGGCPSSRFGQLARQDGAAQSHALQRRHGLGTLTGADAVPSKSPAVRGHCNRRGPAHRSARGRASTRCWRRRTLPPGCPGSTIRAAGLNFRVRDGIGCVPCAMATSKVYLVGARILASDVVGTMASPPLLASPATYQLGTSTARGRAAIRSALVARLLSHPDYAPSTKVEPVLGRPTSHDQVQLEVEGRSSLRLVLEGGVECWSSLSGH